MGGAASLHERHREARGLPAFDGLLHDLRFALRLLIKDRWFTLYAADQAIDVSNFVTARLSLPPGQSGTPQERIAFYEQLELRLACPAPTWRASALDPAVALRRD